MTRCESTDYIIIGAGAAGCVLAARLTESGKHTVCVIEAGPAKAGLLSKIPVALDFALHDDRYNWYYHTEPEPYMDGRKIYCPRGRMLGGSSAINGMMYIRGNPRDFNGWADLGLNSWSYTHCLPYFKKLERYERGADDYRGDKGPLHVTAGKAQNPLDQAFLKAAIEAGHQHSDDTNGFQQEGYGIADRNTYKGRRWSAADAYLKPSLGRSNLTVNTMTLVHRILFDGLRAVGVEFSCDGATRQVYADKEVILCGGAINSPQLLMLSGLGDAAHLMEHDIPLVQHMAGVGENLQDHLDIRVQKKCRRPVSIYPASKGLGKLLAGAHWLFNRGGICGSNLFEVAGYIRTREDALYPNMQSAFMPIAASYDGQNSYHGHGYQAHIDMMRPSSRGRIKLKSKDPSTPPSIVFNYLQTHQDQQDVIKALQLTRDLLRQNAFAEFDGGELSPGEHVQSDAEILAWARGNGETEYHPTSSCAMGVDDKAVVDEQLKVQGIDALRVVDASIMPNIVTANTHAASLMIAEKAADLILGKTPLSPMEVPYF